MADRKTLFVRVDPDIHRRVIEYATSYDFAVNDVVLCLIEQLLVQVDSSFPVPVHLARHFKRRVPMEGDHAPKT